MEEEGLTAPAGQSGERRNNLHNDKEAEQPFVQQGSSISWRSVAVVALLAAGVWCFMWLASLSGHDNQQAANFDHTLLLALREAGDPADPIGSAEIEAAVRDITALGSATVLGFITICAVVLLLLRRNYRTAFVLLLAVVGGTLLTMTAKDIYARPRPTVVQPVVSLDSFSFPSGHATVAAVTYLTIGILLARTQTRPLLRVYVLSIAILVTLAVGLSRVYLGVHWPTDVVAGWLAGGLWAMLVWLVAGRLEAFIPD